MAGHTVAEPAGRPLDGWRTATPGVVARRSSNDQAHAWTPPRPSEGAAASSTSVRLVTASYWNVTGTAGSQALPRTGSALSAEAAEPAVRSVFL